MAWLFLALTTAFFTSLTDAVIKRSLKKVDIYVVAWGWRFFVALFLLPLLLSKPLPEVKPPFFTALAVSSCVMFIGTLLYCKAIQSSDLSVTVPMMAFTPVFLLITSPLILGEFPRPIGLVGILLIVGGSYVLNVKERAKGLWQPFAALFREKGPRYMMIVAFLFSIGGNFDKIGVLNSSPLFWLVCLDAVAALLLFPVMLLRQPRALRSLKTYFVPVVLMGLMEAVALGCQMTALQWAIVPYVISIKRTSVIWSSLLGFWLFREAGIRERLTGAVVMVIGIIFIALG